MTTQEILAKVQAALEAAEKLGDQCWWTMRASRYGVDLTVMAPSAQGTLTDEQRHTALGAVTPLVGRLDKHEAHGEISFRGAKDGLEVCVRDIESCKIVGHRIEKRPKVLVQETGEFEEIRIPVTDCDLKQGRVDAGQVVREAAAA